MTTKKRHSSIMKLSFVDITHETATSGKQATITNKAVDVMVFTSMTIDWVALEVYANGKLVARSIRDAWYAFRFDQDGRGTRLRLFGSWYVFDGHRAECTVHPCICDTVTSGDELYGRLRAAALAPVEQP